MSLRVPDHMRNPTLDYTTACNKRIRRPDQYELLSHIKIQESQEDATQYKLTTTTTQDVL